MKTPDSIAEATKSLAAHCFAHAYSAGFGCTFHQITCKVNGGIASLGHQQARSITINPMLVAWTYQRQTASEIAEKILEVIAHEMTHVEQEITGRLSYGWDSANRKWIPEWDGVQYRVNLGSKKNFSLWLERYKAQPWEADAFANERPKSVALYRSKEVRAAMIRLASAIKSIAWARNATESEADIPVYLDVLLSEDSTEG